MKLIFLIRSVQSIGKDQLFSTKPRLARSGSKSKLDKSQLPPTDPSLTSRQTNDSNSNGKNNHRTINTNIDVNNQSSMNEKSPVKEYSTETSENKYRTQITKGNYILK